jgi:hypothetical protein
MPIPWQKAVSLYAKKIGHFVLPAKGSEHYAAVKKIQAETEMSDEHKMKPRKARAPKAPKDASVKMEAADKLHADVGARVNKNKLPMRKGLYQGKVAPTSKGGAAAGLTSNADPILPPAATTTMLEDAQVSKEKLKGIIRRPLKKKEAAKPGGVKADGLSKPIATQEFLVNENTGPSAIISNQYADQKADIAKSLKRGKKMGGDTSEAPQPNPPDMTVPNLPTNDKPALQGGKVPFSMAALRLRIGA